MIVRGEQEHPLARCLLIPQEWDPRGMNGEKEARDMLGCLPFLLWLILERWQQAESINDGLWCNQEHVTQSADISGPKGSWSWQRVLTWKLQIVPTKKALSGVK